MDSKEIKRMKLLEFKKYIDDAVKRAGEVAEGADIEICLGEKSYIIKSISQFGVKPDVVIDLGEVYCDYDGLYPIDSRWSMEEIKDMVFPVFREYDRDNISGDEAIGRLSVFVPQLLAHIKKLEDDITNR